MILTLIGLPGSGKTTLAKALLKHVDAIHLNADDVRADLSADLDFSPEARIEQARRLGAMARLLSNQGRNVIVDFVNPTTETRKAFGKSDFLIWIDRIKQGRFEDTNKLWQDPSEFSIVFREYSVAEAVATILSETGLPDYKAPTTLMLGRYQPWHEGHNALYELGFDRTNQVLVGVRDTQGTSAKDPLSHNEVEGHVRNWQPNAFVMRLPNITNIIYGRDVGYKIEQIELSPELQAISATQKRAELGI
jgi:adenylylsulfate kinase